MKKASQVLYTVGKVFNVIEIVGLAIITALGILVMAFPEWAFVSNMLSSMNFMRGSGMGLILSGAIGLIISSIVLYFANRATKSLENNVTENSPHVIMIIIGVFGVIFYLIGGILGVVAENTEDHVKT